MIGLLNGLLPQDHSQMFDSRAEVFIDGVALQILVETYAIVVIQHHRLNASVEIGSFNDLLSIVCIGSWSFANVFNDQVALDCFALEKHCVFFSFLGYHYVKQTEHFQIPLVIQVFG